MTRQEQIEAYIKEVAERHKDCDNCSLHCVFVYDIAEQLFKEIEGLHKQLDFYKRIAPLHPKG